MNVCIAEVKEPNKKSRFAEEILRRLPEWFGNEKALIEYVNGVASLPFWAALNSDGKCIGFISIKVHYGNTGDIYVLGVLPEHHRKGIGKSLCCFTPLLKHPDILLRVKLYCSSKVALQRNKLNYTGKRCKLNRIFDIIKSELYKGGIR